MASLVDREWIRPTGSKIDHRFENDTGQVRAVETELYGQIPLSERFVTPDPRIAAELLAEAVLRHGLSAEEQQLIHRLRFAGRKIDVPQLIRAACAGARKIEEVRLAHSLPREWLREADRLAPERLQAPSGRSVRLDYSSDGSVSASVKLQELFGLAETPRIGPRHEAILLVLLAPNGRPVQQTRDLRSFWERGYPEVRKELRARYPRHPWPEDPWSATPTARTRPRGESK
jgi:ATP-dependent helicase HrpB